MASRVERKEGVSFCLREICNALAKVGHKWSKIGTQLGIPHHKLKEFEKENDSLAAVVNFWLCGNVDTVPCSWRSVVRALKSHHVDEAGLAKRIEEKYLNEEYFNSDDDYPLLKENIKDLAIEKQLNEEEKYLNEEYFNSDDDYPLLKKNIKDLPIEEKEKLLLQLNERSERICHSFGILVSRTESYLQRSQITAERLRSLFAQIEIQELADDINSTDSIPDVMFKVKKGKYWSFFNYDILKTIIECFCHEEPSIIAQLGKYMSEFEDYCKHRVSEVNVKALNGEHTTTQFKVKLDDIFNVDTTLEQLKRIQFKLQKILKKEPILLVKIESGCIEVTFRYFNNQKKIFPINEEQKHSLAEIGVQWLCHGDYEVQLKTKLPTKAMAPVYNPTLVTITMYPPVSDPSEAKKVQEDFIAALEVFLNSRKNTLEVLHSIQEDIEKGDRLRFAAGTAVGIVGAVAGTVVPVGAVGAGTVGTVAVTGATTGSLLAPASVPLFKTTALSVTLGNLCSVGMFSEETTSTITAKKIICAKDVWFTDQKHMKDLKELGQKYYTNAEATAACFKSISSKVLEALADLVTAPLDPNALVKASRDVLKSKRNHGMTVKDKITQLEEQRDKLMDVLKTLKALKFEDEYMH